ncbi:MAG TPA: GNAT family N-acetyltransferase [Candidatus Limnocylindrales bacterium]|nr:GNAT family N-acetyltransferase [Candidatus Limnocylindrales bacterium]
MGVRPELTRRADYAIRGMLCLARRAGQISSGAAIAAETQIPGRFVTQVMGDLVHAGLVDARIGRSGGYRLAAASDTISILAVVEAVEGDTHRTTCVLRDGRCNANNPCDVHEVFAQAQKALVERLARTTLADIVGAEAAKIDHIEPAGSWHADEDVVIRRIQPSDRELLPDFYASLSQDSRYSRFLGSGSLSDETMRSFCTPDHMHDEGFVALSHDADRSRVVGHLCLEPAGPGRLELAVAVSDQVQGRGIGRRLMEAALQWATSRHFEAILASALGGNSRVLRLLTSAPYPAHVAAAASGTVDIVIPLVPDLLPNGPTELPVELRASARRRVRSRRHKSPSTRSCSRVVWRDRRPPARGAGG